MLVFSKTPNVTVKKKAGDHQPRTVLNSSESESFNKAQGKNTLNKIGSRVEPRRPPLTDVGTETTFRLDQRKHFQREKPSLEVRGQLIRSNHSHRRFRKRWRRPRILQFCGDSRLIRRLHVLIKPRPSPYTSILPAKQQDLRPSPSFTKSSILLTPFSQRFSRHPFFVRFDHTVPLRNWQFHCKYVSLWEGLSKHGGLSPLRVRVPERSVVCSQALCVWAAKRRLISNDRHRVISLWILAILV